MVDDVQIDKWMILQPHVAEHEWFFGWGNYRGNLSSFLGNIFVAMELPDRLNREKKHVQAALKTTLAQHTALLATVHGQLLWRGFGASDFLQAMEDVFSENNVRLEDFAVREKVVFEPPEWNDWKGSGAEFTVWRWKPEVAPYLAGGIGRAMSDF